METVNFSKAREELAGLFDKVSRDRVPVEVTRRDKSSVVLVDKDEFESIMETIHLLSTRANAERLLRAAEDVKAGKNIVEHDLID
jgi:antitoxin YefM